MNIKYLLLSTLCALVLTACSAHQKIYPDSNHVLDQSSGKGLVFFSYSSFGLHDVPFSLLYRRTPNKRLVNVGELSLVNRGSQTGYSYSNKYGSKSHQNSDESLHVFNLPEGQYEFYGMFIEEDYEQADWTIVTDFSIPFEVTSGKITYIGNIDIQTASIGNNDYVVKSELSRNNRLDDDLVTLSEQFPNLKKDDIVSFSGLDKEKGESIVRIHYGRERSLGQKII